MFAIVVGLVILLGIVLRCSHVDRRVFWDDEVIASLHIAGITEGELVRRAGNLRTMGALNAVVHPIPPLRSPGQSVAALRLEDPQHPPLYYLIARLWVGLFGDSRTALRTLSALIGCAALPAMYWLCLELFASRRAAWAGTALLAVSPVAYVYSQEVREYELWLVGILASSALFARAMRRSTLTNWLLYALALGASLYVFPVSVFVGLAHLSTAAFVPATLRTRLAALAAATLGVVLFSPWLIVIVTHIGQINRGMATIDQAQVSPLNVVRTFIGVVRLEILDINGGQKLLAGILSVPIVGVAAYAVYALRSAPLDISRGLIWMTLIWTTFPIILPDVMLGGDRTANARYFIPFFVALDLALVGLFTLKLTPMRIRTGSAKAWAIVFAAILITRAGSCALASQAQTWWSDYNNRSIAVAAALNDARRPVLVSDDYIVWALSLSEYADPRIRTVLKPRCYLCTLPAGGALDLAFLTTPPPARSVFLLAPSKELQREVKVALRARADRPAYECIDVRDNCADGLSLW